MLGTSQAFEHIRRFLFIKKVSRELRERERLMFSGSRVVQELDNRWNLERGKSSDVEERP